MRPILLLTRPQPQALHFARRMQALGADCLVLIAPLSRIVPLPFDPAGFDDAAGLILTSANAVPLVPTCPGLPAWCVGPATTRATTEAGFNAQNAGGDAAALVATLSAQRPTGRLIHAHGVHLAKDLSAALRAQGLDVQGIAVYEAQAVQWEPTVLARLKAAQRVIAPLFSPRAARRFMQGLEGVRLNGLQLVAISAACAAQLPADLQAQTVVADTPDADGMMQAITSALSQAGTDTLRP